MARAIRVLSVNSVQFALQKSEPPKLVVFVQGTAATPGYQNIRLNALEDEISPDGIYDLELVGEPPEGPAVQIVTPVAASLVVDIDVNKIVGVMVHARTNSVTEFVISDPIGPGIGGGAVRAASISFPHPFPEPGRLPPDFPKTIIGEGPKPVIGERPKLIFGEDVTTLAIGEETPGTFAGGFAEGSGPFAMEKSPIAETGGLKSLAGEGFDPREAFVRRGPFGLR